MLPPVLLGTPSRVALPVSTAMHPVHSAAPLLITVSLVVAPKCSIMEVAMPLVRLALHSAQMALAVSHVTPNVKSVQQALLTALSVRAVISLFLETAFPPVLHKVAQVSL